MKTVELKIDHLTKEGTGVSRLDKKPIYVKYALEGESILANIDFEGKRNVFASIREIKKSNPYRCNSECSVYYKCGGCHLSHMTYEGQMKFKTDVVKKIYKQAGFQHVDVHDCFQAEIPYYYRNKVQTPIGKKGKKIVAGFFKEDSHDIIPFDNCLVQDELSNKIIKLVVKSMIENKIEPYDEDAETGVVRHVLIRRAEKETMLVLITKVDSFPGRNNFVSSLKKYIPELTTIVQNVNKRVTNVILGEKENVLYGKGFISDTLCGITFKISPKSFYQINKVQCENLYSKAISLAKLTGKETVLDAYCGIGTIGMIASKHAKEVYGVEIIPDAIVDAKKNAKYNQIENCYFYCADAEDFIRKIDKKLDVVFVDPPRKGCSTSFLKSLVYHKPQKIVYISCNPETQASDVKFLVENGYQFKEVYPYDMFPQTYHVETIVLLSHRNPDTTIDVELSHDDLPLTKSEMKATYKDIENYVMEKYGVKITSLEVAQIKEKYGIKERANYNKQTSNSKYLQPKCGKEKEEYITEALKHFKMIK